MSSSRDVPRWSACHNLSDYNSPSTVLTFAAAPPPKKNLILRYDSATDVCVPPVLECAHLDPVTGMPVYFEEHTHDSERDRKRYERKKDEVRLFACVCPPPPPPPLPPFFFFLLFDFVFFSCSLHPIFAPPPTTMACRLCAAMEH